MLILALDSAARGCSVAVWQDGKVLADCDQVMTYGQAEALVPMIQAVRNEARIAFADIDLFAVTVGPGSFTGVRVGLATARGLGLAAARPVVGVTTTEAVALEASTWDNTRDNSERPIVVILESYRADVYIQPFLVTSTLPVPLGPIQTLMPKAVKYFLSTLPFSIVVTGDGVPRLIDDLPAVTIVRTEMQPRARAVATIAAAREINATQRIAPVPIYLRAPTVATTVSSRS